MSPAVAMGAAGLAATGAQFVAASSAVNNKMKHLNVIDEWSGQRPPANSFVSEMKQYPDRVGCRTLHLKCDGDAKARDEMGAGFTFGIAAGLRSAWLDEFYIKGVDADDANQFSGEFHGGALRTPEAIAEWLRQKGYNQIKGERKNLFGSGYIDQLWVVRQSAYVLAKSKEPNTLARWCIVNLPHENFANRDAEIRREEAKLQALKETEEPSFTWGFLKNWERRMQEIKVQVMKNEKANRTPALEKGFAICSVPTGIYLCAGKDGAIRHAPHAQGWEKFLFVPVYGDGSEGPPQEHLRPYPQTYPKTYPDASSGGCIGYKICTFHRSDTFNGYNTNICVDNLGGLYHDTYRMRNEEAGSRPDGMIFKIVVVGIDPNTGAWHFELIDANGNYVCLGNTRGRHLG